MDNSVFDPFRVSQKLLYAPQGTSESEIVAFVGLARVAQMSVFYASQLAIVKDQHGRFLLVDFAELKPL